MKVTCVIAAYNESERIGKVLSAACGHPLLDELIVVDDGSKDNTSEIARGYAGCTVVALEKNSGKCFAVAKGISMARNEIIMMLDADLIGVDADGISKLIQPVLDGSADFTMSLRKNSLGIYKLFRLDFVSGERVFAKNLLYPYLDYIAKLPGYALEVSINRLIIKNGLRLKSIYLENWIAPRKSKKIGFLAGTASDWHMIGEILKVVSIWEVTTQFIKLLRLKV